MIKVGIVFRFPTFSLLKHLWQINGRGKKYLRKKIPSLYISGVSTHLVLTRVELRGKSEWSRCFFFACGHWHKANNFADDHGKGQLNSEWIYEGILFSKMQTKKSNDFCLTKQKRIIAKNTAYTHQNRSATILVCMVGQKSL